MHNPELHSLAGINWQFFCTFTFARERVPVGVRASMFFALLRNQAFNSGVHFKRLVWCLRTERGDQTGRLHFHSVIAGFPSHWVNRMTCLAMMNGWKSLGGGHARVTIYSPLLDGVDYILKGGDAETSASRYAGDYHELTKFGSACEVTLSESCLHVLAGRRGYRKDTASSTVQRTVSNSPSLSQRHCGGDNASNVCSPCAS